MKFDTHKKTYIFPLRVSGAAFCLDRCLFLGPPLLIEQAHN